VQEIGDGDRTSARVAVVGGGPAGLMAAEVLAGAGVAVTVYERMRSPGRKFQLAGRGGLNLTHTEPLDRLLDRYGEARPGLEAALRSFDPMALRAWSTGLGQRAVVGTSGRVFPEAFRATPLLRAWLARLDDLGVQLRTGVRWTGWDDAGRLTFAGDVAPPAVDATVLALGGASWPRTGSDGAWTTTLAAEGVAVTPLRPANGGLVVAWSEHFRDRFGGTPLKNVALSTAGAEPVRGEAMVTAGGLEGGAVYAVGPAIRRRLESRGSTELHVDLRPDLTVDELTRRLSGHARPKDSRATMLRRAAGLTPVAAGLLREVHGPPRPDERPSSLARAIKDLVLTVTGTAPLDRAISTAGGIALDEVDERFMLRRRPGTFVAGEMLDWEAPTGGYLLQATFSTAVAAAHGALAWLGER
jgi:uncharacterized flavoprotein (TIGR03862 family)